MQEFTLFTFPSTHQALKAERVLQAAGLEGRLLPMPREISSLCGLVLEVDREEEGKALEVLKGVVKLEKKVRIRKEQGLLKDIEEVIELEGQGAG
ncbi:Protein of unknown function [Thermanaeromonas toyohensis ToBE]|uniref:Putative Se/S carrier protein-like domain-containing protein n=1 Tax=Thermanaeromonas toyohensis ToBE TaxID=698762 RepID=A0A1W1VY01_9FIRM|nr:DUF3343 domain-containing protein [Thermanaeromonas toyohensis]SMB98262.1 Protein of unknown function [Thermanaeromonas toyohensis ToBE]